MSGSCLYRIFCPASSSEASPVPEVDTDSHHKPNHLNQETKYAMAAMHVSLISKYAMLPVGHHLTLLPLNTSLLPVVTQPLKLMTVSNTVFTVFSGIGLTLSVIPLWWHLGSRNVGTCMYAVWTALACFIFFVDSIVWDGNTINRAPVWCDICTSRYPFARLVSLMTVI